MPRNPCKPKVLRAPSCDNIMENCTRQEGEADTEARKDMDNTGGHSWSKGTEEQGATGQDRESRPKD